MASIDLKQGTDDKKEPDFSGMDFFPDGRLVAIDHANKILSILNENLEKVGLFLFTEVRHCVCTISNKEIVVTSGGIRVIEFFSISETNKISLTRTLNVSTSYFSICLMNTSTFLVSTLNDRRPLRMVTRRGEEKDFENLPDKIYGINNSCSIYLPSRNILVLTDASDNSVHLYDVVDNFVTRRVVKHQALEHPLGVSVGPEDCLFICSVNTDSIVQVSASGKVISSNKVSFRFPVLTCVSKDRKRMAVSNGYAGKRKLYLFHLM